MVVIEYLPDTIIRSLPQIALILVGLLIEQHYVSRVSIFTNSLALTVHYLSLESVSEPFTLYVEFGLLLGFYGIYRYLREESVGQAYYVTTFYCYSSLVVGGIIFLPIPPFWAFCVALIAQLMMIAQRGSLDAWVWAGPRPGEVQAFIEDRTIEYVNHNRQWVRVSLSEIFD